MDNIIYVLLILIQSLSIIECREYCINDTVNPSYLHKIFEKASIDIFPNVISINTSMSKVAGTLMYSLDGNMNQLIVRLRNALPHIIDIEFNTQIFSAFLPSLCGCERCRYEILDIRIQVNEYIRILCNGRVEHTGTVRNEYKKELNPNYPLPSFGSSDYTSIWFVNTPTSENLGTNVDQITGCIYDIKINDSIVSDMKVKGNVGTECIKTCIDNVCNGGQCYETFGLRPICNCSSTILNGEYCNDTFPKYNARLMDQLLEIDMFKVSWNTSINEFFELKNSKVSISLRHENDVLYAIFNSSKIRKIYMKTVLLYNYDTNKEFVVIAYFRKKRNIDFMLYNNGSWNSIMILTYHDIRKELFDSILLRSGRGYIDMVYKDEQEYKWRRLIIGPYEKISLDDPLLKPEIEYKTLFYILAGILTFIILSTGILLFLLYKYRNPLKIILLRKLLSTKDELHDSKELQNLNSDAQHSSSYTNC